jgi:predicted RND superfamily exporter protein
MSKVINIKKKEDNHHVHEAMREFDEHIEKSKKAEKSKDVEHIIAGTENAYKVEKPSKKEVNQYMKKFKEYKENYIKDHSLEEMVYENGSALALLYKEITRLNQLLTTNLKRNGKEN